MTFSSIIASRWLAACFCLCSFGFAQVAKAGDPVDIDLDGIPDAWETQVFGTDPAEVDTDGDGFDDKTEITSGFDPLKTKAALKEADFDKDNLSDRLELLFRTDPTLADTDGDGHMDGEEVKSAYSPTSTEPIVLPKSIKIVLSKQRLMQQVMGIPISSFIMSSGLPKTPTPVGTYKVLSKNKKAWSSSAKLWMPYWMHFSGRGHGIHELPEWPGGKKEGASHLGKVASHGCVRLGIGSAKSVYEWSPVGTQVIVVKSDVPQKNVMVVTKTKVKL